MKRVKYLIDVTHPTHLIGENGEEKEILEADANLLASTGHVEILE